MIERFSGEKGQRLRVQALAAQRLLAGNEALADELAQRGEILAVEPGRR